MEQENFQKQNQNSNKDIDEDDDIASLLDQIESQQNVDQTGDINNFSSNNNNSKNNNFFNQNSMGSNFNSVNFSQIQKAPSNNNQNKQLVLGNQSKVSKQKINQINNNSGFFKNAQNQINQNNVSFNSFNFSQQKENQQQIKPQPEKQENANQRDNNQNNQQNLKAGNLSKFINKFKQLQSIKQEEKDKQQNFQQQQEQQQQQFTSQTQNQQNFNQNYLKNNTNQYQSQINQGRENENNINNYQNDNNKIKNVQQKKEYENPNPYNIDMNNSSQRMPKNYQVQTFENKSQITQYFEHRVQKPSPFNTLQKGKKKLRFEESTTFAYYLRGLKEESSENYFKTCMDFEKEQLKLQAELQQENYDQNKNIFFQSLPKFLQQHNVGKVNSGGFRNQKIKNLAVILVDFDIYKDIVTVLFKDFSGEIKGSMPKDMLAIEDDEEDEDSDFNHGDLSQEQVQNQQQQEIPNFQIKSQGLSSSKKLKNNMKIEDKDDTSSDYENITSKSGQKDSKNIEFKKLLKNNQEIRHIKKYEGQQIYPRINTVFVLKNVTVLSENEMDPCYLNISKKNIGELIYPSKEEE